MRMLTVLSVIALLALVCGNVHVNAKKSKWLKKPQIVVLKKNHGEIKEDAVDQETAAKRSHGHHHKHRKIPRRRLNFKKTDALPYSSPYSRPYDWSMYTDGPFGWGPSRKRREMNSFNQFKRSLYPQNYAPQYSNQQQATGQPAQQAAYVQPAQQAAYVQPAQQAAYVQPAQQRYNYQGAATRNTLAQAGAGYRSPPSTKSLQKKAPAVQQPQERTWVDKLGVKWTTRKVNDYKWGEREPGITMDEYAGGPFGFNDIKRDHITRANPRQWQRRSSIPRSSSAKLQRRSWIDKNGVAWTMDHVNDYKWGEREPGINMDEYNGGPYGWGDVKRDRISVPRRRAKPRNMYMEKP